MDDQPPAPVGAAPLEHEYESTTNRGASAPAAGATAGAAAALAAAAACFWLLLVCSSSARRGVVSCRAPPRSRHKAAARQTGGPMPVGTATVEKGDMPVTLSGLGTVTPLAMVTVKTQINGQLIEVGFQEGQMVNKGDFLAQIDPRPYQVALEQAAGPARQGPGAAEERRARSRALQDAGRAELDRHADARHPGRPGRAGPGHGEGRSGAGRRAKAEPRPIAISSRRSAAGSGCARSMPAITCRPASPTASSSSPSCSRSR